MDQNETRVEAWARAAGAPGPEAPLVRTTAEQSVRAPPIGAAITLAALSDGVELA